MLSQNPRHADFVLGSCPSCEKVVRIPVTAVTSQSKAQVRCPICDSAFELADVLEEMIPEVEVVDGETTTTRPSKTTQKINAIDTPELFHVSKDDYEPITEKKNGRFVVPDLLSKGIKKKKRRRSRRRRSSSEKDPRIVKLKENTSTTSLPDSTESTGESANKSAESTARENAKNSDSSANSRKKRSSKKTRHRKSTIEKIPTPKITRVRSFSDFVAFLKACKSVLSSKASRVTSDVEQPSSRAEYIMIGLGVLIAIPILHLMMWWFVGIDPLGLAKPTSSIAPFIVPNELKSPIADDAELEAAEPSRQTNLNDNRLQRPAAERSPDGKLPTPKLDPSSVHVDNY